MTTPANAVEISDRRDTMIGDSCDMVTQPRPARRRELIHAATGMNAGFVMRPVGSNESLVVCATAKIRRSYMSSLQDDEGDVTFGSWVNVIHNLERVFPEMGSTSTHYIQKALARRGRLILFLASRC
jgi:hypothetical protein